jgi:sulfur carrier protein
MNIQVNGEDRKIKAGETIDSLVKKQNRSKQRIAVLLNDELVPTDKRAGQILKEGDRVEILTFAGGG